MEVKKSPQFDLENERSTFLLLGLVVALSIFFFVLEWQNQDTFQLSEEDLNHLFIEEEFKSTGQENLLPLPPSSSFSSLESEIVKPELSVVMEDFHPVDNSTEVSQNLDTLPRVSLEQIEAAEQHTEIKYSSKQEADVVTEAEIIPEFPGGHDAMMRYIYQQVRYPSTAAKQRIQGRVLCSFIINKDGTLSDVKLEKGVYVFLDEEALRVIKSMPVWKPGLINNKPVRFKYYLPLVFRL